MASAQRIQVGFNRTLLCGAANLAGLSAHHHAASGRGRRWCCDRTRPSPRSRPRARDHGRGNLAHGAFDF